MAVVSDTCDSFQPARATPTADYASIYSASGMQLDPSIIRSQAVVRPQDGTLPSTRPSTSSTAAQCNCNPLLPCVFEVSFFVFINLLKSFMWLSHRFSLL